jgi:FkbM family methyltransferase
MTVFEVYKHYPFKIPLRVKFFNLFRYFFRFSFLEKYLVARLSEGPLRYWRRFIPPLYFYETGSIRTVERNSIKYKLDISTLLDHSIYFYRIRDKAWDNLFKLLRKDFHVIDVGANIGFLSLNFAVRCPDGMIHSFEPDSDTFYKLRENVRLNGFQNVSVYKKALGSVRATGELYKIYANNPGANRILSAKPPAVIPSEKVEISTLDETDQELGFVRLDLLKIDVEGFELFVIKGGRNLILKRRPILFVELIDQNLAQQGCTAQSMIDYIQQLGYSIVDAQSMSPLTPSENYYTDIICFPDPN